MNNLELKLLADFDMTADMISYIRFCDFYQEIHGRLTMNKSVELDLSYIGDHISGHIIIRKKYINVVQYGKYNN